MYVVHIDRVGQRAHAYDRFRQCRRFHPRGALCHQGVLVRESPFGAELEDAPFVLEVCGLHYGLLGEVCNDSGGGPHG